MNRSSVPAALLFTLLLSTGGEACPPLYASAVPGTVTGATIVNSANHLCMTAQGTGPVTQATCALSSAAQAFNLVPQLNGYLLLQNQAANSCVAASGGVLVAAACNALDSTQQFFPSYQRSAGQFALLGRYSGLCVGSPAATSAVGAQLAVMDCAASVPQVYTISALPAPGPTAMPAYSRTGAGRAASVPGNPFGIFTTIIAGKTFNGDVALYNATNTLFIGNTVINGAVKIDNATNLYLKNNTLVNSEIWFRDLQQSDNIVIDGNEIFSSPTDCMLVVAGSTNINPTHVSVINNEFHDCGTRYPGSGLYHGIYDQAPGVLFENNLFYHNKDDISIRSSGTIRRNVFRDDVLGASILYMADHPAPAGSTLLIENNILTGEVINGVGGNKGNHRGFVQFTAASQAPVANYVVRFNTMVLTNPVDDLTGIYWDVISQVPFSATTTTGQFYGNILVNQLHANYLGYQAPTYSGSNVETQSLTGLNFVDAQYHLGGAGSVAASFANTEPSYPSTDRDLNLRPGPAGNIDADAQQLQ